MRRNHLTTLLLLIAVILTSCEKKRSEKPNVLVFSKAAGYLHKSIPAGVEAVMKLGLENGFNVDTTSNAALFEEENLKKYASVIFMNNSGNVLDTRQQVTFERYIQAGGSFVGVHGASDTEYDWGWYGRLLGAYFKNHPKIQEAKFIVEDKTFPATSFFKDSVWLHRDELYNFRNIYEDINVILSIDENSYEGGENPDHHPISWYHEYDGGRSFYTALGHVEECYSDEQFLQHLLAGIQYAIGDNSEPNYANATSQYPPDDDRFSKVQLAQGDFYEPTEMTILPNLDILVVQRRGEILLFKNETAEVKQVGFLDVYSTASVPNVNAEEGVMGLAKDPNFENNHWIYIYYSPADKSVNRLSRFTFENETVDLATEKVVLEVVSQRQICCHTGGSIAFSADGLLFLSTGDNSTPFNDRTAPYSNNGFAPLNDEPGKQQYDARRSSGNTNDLRGKILRIKVNEDATYDIPEGNLFPVGMEKTRPEIYTMGHRNPYRISVDQKNSFLYWGDVGPDARADSLSVRGPRGYDEVGQARVAGNFGWPYLIADNKPYFEYNYATGETGTLFDPEKLINNSRNNTGLKEIPPGKSAFIWYPYASSRRFPQVETGGRNAMAGPVYYTDMFPESTRLPDYYDGKLIVYDWIRGWIRAVTMKPNGDFDKMEPFFPDLKVNSLIDMEVGPDGKLYLLEYGSGWFQKNPDAGIARIDYNPGNRAPKLTAMEIDKTSGILPLTISAKIGAIDPENDNLTYSWEIGNDNKVETTTPTLEHTFAAAGAYDISVTVNDGKGGITNSNTIQVYAGNERPIVSIDVNSGNKSFHLPGIPIQYAIAVSDEKDNSGIDTENMYVSVDYIEGYDQANASMGHQENVQSINGKTLMLSMDCKACHSETEKSVGPAYIEVSKKYNGESNVLTYLSERIINGGGGVWGETQMPAHPSISQGDVHQIVNWIIGLSNTDKKKPSLPAVGTLMPDNIENASKTLVLSASYTDKGDVNIKPLTGNSTYSLPGSLVRLIGDEEISNFVKSGNTGNITLRYPQNDAYFSLNKIDLTAVKSLDIMNSWRRIPSIGFKFEVRLDAIDGKLLGKGSIPKPLNGSRGDNIHISLEQVDDGQFHKIYFIYTSENKDADVGNAAMFGVRFNSK